MKESSHLHGGFHKPDRSVAQILLPSWEQVRLAGKGHGAPVQLLILFMIYHGTEPACKSNIFWRLLYILNFLYLKLCIMFKPQWKC